MKRDIPTDRMQLTPLSDTFERYLQDKGKGRGGEGGNYRRNVTRELKRFAEWATGEQGPDNWTGIVANDGDREPTFEELNERVFREYARYLAGDRGLKQNTVQTYYRYLSAWCGWCVNEDYLEAHYAQRASAMAPLPDDDGRKPGRPISAMPSPDSSTSRLAMPLRSSQHYPRRLSLLKDSEPDTPP